MRRLPAVELWNRRYGQQCVDLQRCSDKSFEIPGRNRRLLRYGRSTLAHRYSETGDLCDILSRFHGVFSYFVSSKLATPEQAKLLFMPWALITRLPPGKLINCTFTIETDFMRPKPVMPEYRLGC